MRLNDSEKVIWAACYSSRYAKEQARGIPRPRAARAAAAHASNAVDALRDAYKAMGAEERQCVGDVLGEREVEYTRPPPTSVPGPGVLRGKARR